MWIADIHKRFQRREGKSIAFGVNRAAARPQATFQVAGGTIMKYRHPFLSGQISRASPVDEVDVSRSVKLNETFFRALPAQDNSIQEVLVDGSVVTITNHLLAGTIAIPVIRTKGTVGKGCLIAALHLVIGSKDDVGGTFTLIETIDGLRIVTVFYGVSSKNVPHLIKAGNAIVPFDVVLSYAGFVQGVSANSEVNAKTIWAVGNKVGINAVYRPFGIQTGEDTEDFFGGLPATDVVMGMGRGDSATGDLADTADLASVETAEGVAQSPAPSEHEVWDRA